MRKLATLRSLALGFLLIGNGLWSQQSQAPQAGQKPATQPAQQAPSTSDLAATLKVDVNLVNVFVTVTDEHGAPIGGLKKENFVLKEDDHEQRISVFDKESALPLSIALTIDTSLSTRHDLPLAH